MNSPLQKIRETKPLIHHITNWVTIYECANMTRAFGALPVMAHSPEECADMTAISSALVLNIGTLMQSALALLNLEMKWLRKFLILST
jgi:hydroxyethylthiazole kinase